MKENHPLPPHYFAPEGYDKLRVFVREQQPSLIVILVDENTQEFCLPKFLQTLETDAPIEVIEIEAGEEHKTIDTCTGVWNAMTELEVDRNSLLINLGGGMLTDLGGFVASTFKRGMDFIHVPTSLLAMVDAAIGGKTGVDLGNLKNQIGVFSQPVFTLIDPAFLETLPQNQWKGGLAEMLKHGLVYRRSYWEKMSDLSQLTSDDLLELIRESVKIKCEIVFQDPSETGLRKILNFGHTLGHAIESHFLQAPEKTTLLHGEAIGIGMILEAYISSEILSFSKNVLDEMKRVILHSFSKIEFKKTDLEPILELLKHDKKNSRGNVNFVLLHDVGNAKIDCLVEKETILRAFNYYAQDI